jgi:hypothetical protein
VIHAVAPAPGITVDAPVLTAPVEIHAVLGREDGFCLNGMHWFSPLSFDIIIEHLFVNVKKKCCKGYLKFGVVELSRNLSSGLVFL